MKTEELNTILERTIDFIKTCENKVSIILSIYGVILTLIFTSDNIKHFYTEVSTHCFIAILFLLIAFYLVFGIGTLVLVLLAQATRPEGLPKSSIFFGDIALESLHDFDKKIKSYDEDSLKTDLISQIYANSLICSKKFKLYNKGMKHSLIAFSAFIIFSILITIY